MADGHTIVSSDEKYDSGKKLIIDQEKYTDNVVKYLTVSDKGKFKWNGPFQSLKMLMTELTKNESKWSASGGYCKLLELNDLAIRWYADSKSLTVNGKLSDDIKSELRNIAGLARPAVEVTSNNYKEAEHAAINTGRMDASDSSCSCAYINADMEGIKLDLTILESRLLTALSENEYESDINLLRVKLKELEGVVRNQDEANRRLIEENVFFKSKLLFLEKLVLNMSQDYQNKGSGISNPISIIEESPTRDNDQLSSLNKNSLSSSRNTNNSLSRDNELSANLTVNNIDLQQSIVSNTIDIDLRNSSFNVVGTRTPQEQNQIPLHVGQQATEVNTSNIDLSNLSQQPNDPNTNDIDLGNINESPSEQILVSSKQKKDTGTLVNRTSKPLKSQPEKEDNNNTGKGTIPCPFLKRRGWCAKGRRCDFKHPSGEQKHLVPCPFLQNRGYCLKRQCQPQCICLHFTLKVMECQQITIINISLVLCRYNSVKMSKYNHRMVEIYDGLKTKT